VSATNLRRLETNLGADAFAIDLGAEAPTTNFMDLGVDAFTRDLGAKAPTRNLMRL
jgi:hypothetical protein